MASAVQLEFLHTMFEAATAAGHVWPAAAACESCDEAAWGKSDLYLEGNNVFGSKTPAHPLYPSITLPTREFEHGKWITLGHQDFVHYPDVAASFRDRMATLVRLAPSRPHYAAALAAKSAEEFLMEVSQTWSTNPKRAAECISILHAHPECFVTRKD